MTNNLVIMKKLTQAEEQIMQVLWSVKSVGYVKDMLELLDEPQPHNNTVATLIKFWLRKVLWASKIRTKTTFIIH